MEPVFAVAHDPTVQPAPQPYGLGQTPPPQVHHGGGVGWRVGARRVLGLVLFLAANAGFALAIYRSRHSARDLALVIVAHVLFTVLVFCGAKLKQLRHDRTRPAAEVAVERRRVRIGVWVVSVALGCTIATRVADAATGLALKLVVWGVTVVVLGLVFHFIFFGKDAERCDVDLGCGQAGRPATALHELSPEEKV
ncbi:hypothetical protein BS78_03G037100 [Paspalum vaginatum]|nr:hypothetical protein BS78_03G037100 [Paspalum vaginatum]